MTQYISKSAVIAEIESRICDIEISQRAGLIKKRDAETKITLFKSIFSLIDTLEVKEVDLDDYYHKFLDKEWFNSTHVRTMSEMMAFTAKHFFELGMAVSNKAQKGE